MLAQGRETPDAAHDRRPRSSCHPPLGAAVHRGDFLVAVPEEREARPGAKDSAQLEARDAKRFCDLGHRQVLAETRDEELLGLPDDLPVGGAGHVALPHTNLVEVASLRDGR